MIESRPSSNIEGRVAVSLARVFGVSVDWLLTGEGAPPSPEAVREAVAAAREREAAAPPASARVA